MLKVTASDTNLENETWTVVIDKSVNSVLPASYQVIPTSSGLKSYIVGAPYAGALAKCERPIVPFCSKPSLLFTVTPDEAAVSRAQAFEFDVRFQLGGFNYNCSTQLNQAAGGIFQVSNATGGWVDTAFKPGLLTFERTDVRIDYMFDTAKKLYQVTAASFGGLGYTFPIAPLPAQPLAWQDGLAVVQVQLDLNSQGGAMSHLISNMSLNWS